MKKLSSKYKNANKRRNEKNKHVPKRNYQLTSENVRYVLKWECGVTRPDQIYAAFVRKNSVINMVTKIATAYMLRLEHRPSRTQRLLVSVLSILKQHNTI